MDEGIQSFNDIKLPYPFSDAHSTLIPFLHRRGHLIHGILYCQSANYYQHEASNLTAALLLQ